MDPITQGALGATAAQCGAKRSERLGAAGLLGFLAGMSADLDVLIRSSEDPLLFLEYHRHFTHSLLFIPVGGLLCALLLFPLLGRRRGLSFRDCGIFCTLGYATHALLDACTTYGTSLLWPFSDARVAWNVISIIDPLYTLPVLLLMGLSAKLGKRSLAFIALSWIVIYPVIGLVQNQRAEAAGHELALSRGHQPLRLEAKPGFANLLLWKLVYETDSHFHVDAVRVGRGTRVYQGSALPKLNIARDFPWLESDTQQARDIERFRLFSNNYLAKDPSKPSRIIDIRYSLLPNQATGLWGIELSPQAGRDDFVSYVTERKTSPGLLRQYFGMVTGR